MEKQKRVTFKLQYKLLKWCNGEKNEKSLRVKNNEEILPGNNFEEEVVLQHENNFNKKELCSERISNRDKLTNGTSNPYMVKNNYLDDLLNQDMFLRPKDSNMKNNENKYLKNHK